MSRARELLAAAWCALAIAACAARAPAARPAVAPAAAAPPRADTQVIPADPHAEIRQLAARIDADRGTLALPPPPVCAPSACDATPMAEAPKASSCQPAPSDACHDTCTLSDSICDDAKQICDLASQLAGDTWAAGKCASAKQTCTDAHARCCACH